MKNSLFFSSILLALALMVTASCDPTLENEGGNKVKFTASTPTVPATKTAYGNTVEGFQLIHWSANDQLRIFSPNAHVENAGASGNQGSSGTASPWHSTDPAFSLNYSYADYEVTDIQTSGHKSTASLKNVGENGLTWTGTGNAVFYAAYPKSTLYTSNSAGKLRFAPFIPGGNGDATPGTQDGDSTKVANMPLLAMKSVASGDAVKLDFYPAYSTFKFVLKSLNEALTVQSVELYIDPTGMTDTEKARMWLSGYCYFDLNALSNPTDANYDSHYLANTALEFEQQSKSIKVNLNNAPISTTDEAVITIFTLPCTIDHLCFRVNFTHDGASYSKMLRMTQNSGWLSFPAGHKAVITGLAVNPDLWTFKTITLKGEPLKWEGKSISTSSDQSPQSSQFAVTGAGVKNVYDLHHNAQGKPYRQYWILPTTTTTARVAFDVMSPFGGKYEITPRGSVDDFEVKYYDETKDNEGHTILVERTVDPNKGTIGKTDEDGKKFPTKVIFTVTPKSTATATSKLWFNVTVTDTNGEKYSIDSETQLYDMRGYHYFVTQCPLGDTH